MSTELFLSHVSLSPPTSQLVATISDIVIITILNDVLELPSGMDEGVGLAVEEEGYTVVGVGLAVVKERCTIVGVGLAVLEEKCTIVGVGLAVLEERCAIVGVGLAVLEERCAIVGVGLAVLEERCIIVGVVVGAISKIIPFGIHWQDWTRQINSSNYTNPYQVFKNTSTIQH